MFRHVNITEKWKSKHYYYYYYYYYYLLLYRLLLFNGSDACCYNNGTFISYFRGSIKKNSWNWYRPALSSVFRTPGYFKLHVTWCLSCQAFKRTVFQQRRRDGVCSELSTEAFTADRSWSMMSQFQVPPVLFVFSITFHNHGFLSLPAAVILLAYVSDGIAPRILNLGTRRGERSPSRPGKDHRYSSGRRLRGPKPVWTRWRRENINADYSFHGARYLVWMG